MGLAAIGLRLRFRAAGYGPILCEVTRIITIRFPSGGFPHASYTLFGVVCPVVS